MKTIVLFLGLVLALSGSGCMTNGLAKFAKEIRQDTNSFTLDFAGWGVIMKFTRNGGGLSALATQGESSGVTVLPVTTWRVQAAK